MNFLEELLSFIFPKTCGMCNKISQSYLCEKCKQKIEKSDFFLNRIENYENDKTKYFNYHAYLFEYKSPIREKILQYKFNNCAYLSKMFSEFFVKNEKICGFFKKYGIIISVPMTKKKISKRGYNQSILIAKEMAKKIENLTIENQILIKIKDNEKQSTLNKIQRAKNVKNVYKVQNEQKIKHKNVLIIDDIYTTGATVNECAKMLKQAGASSVGVLTIAKDFKK